MKSIIKPLDTDVLKKLQSHTQTISISSAVNEVVQNSIDAHATKIKVLLDLENLSFQVNDNGIGIVPDDLSQLGLQDRTSKIVHFNDLHNIKTYGFHGQALFSISNLSHTIILSKAKDYNATWIKNMSSEPNLYTNLNEMKGVDSVVIEPFKEKHSGTIIIVKNLMHNVPVRLKMAKDEPYFGIFAKIKEDMLHILISHSNISLQVSYIDEVNNTHTLFKFDKMDPSVMPSDKYTRVLRDIYGTIIPINSLKSVFLNYKQYSIQGIISKFPLRLRNLQFININNRKYNNQNFMKSINSLFKDAGFEPQNCPIKYVGRPYNFHPLFILDIKCPQNINDLIQDPTKNVNDATFGNIINPLIMKVFKSFLVTQGYITASDNDNIDLNVSYEDNKVENQNEHYNNNLILYSKTRAGRNLSSEVRGRYEISPNITNQKIRKTSTIERPALKYLTKSPIHKLTTKTLRETSLDVIENYNLSNSHCNHNHFSNNSFRIDKSDLKNFNVINQIDNKFILVKVSPIANPETTDLYILDQHACDERIKLEILLQNFISDIITEMVYSQPINNILIELTNMEAELFKHFENELQKWGIYFTINNTMKETITISTVVFESLPDAVITKCNGDANFLKGIILGHLNDLTNCQKLPILPLITRLKDSGSSKNKFSEIYWWKYMNCIPKFFLEIFNSKACRSAIMFGDSLSRIECELLVRKLSECQVPFQCAHGRPSLIPISELRKR